MKNEFTTLVLAVALFFTGYFIGISDVHQAAPCVNQCIGTKTVWDAENKRFFHSPIMKCLKPGVKA